MRRYSRIVLLLIIIVAGVGFSAVLFYTRYGPGLASDSVAYIQGAINLKSGMGYTRFSGEDSRVPITGFPPMFSLILSTLSLAGIDIVQGGRWLNAILFAANVCLSGWLVFMYTRSTIFALLGSLMALGFWGMILSHAWLMSEGLFIFWMLLSMVVFLLYFSKGNRLLLVLTGLLTGLATLTRYAGLSLAATFFLSIILFRRSGWVSRALDAAFLGITSLLPVVLWMVRNFRLAQTMTNRVAGYYTISYDLIAAYMHEWTTWLFPRPFDLPWRPRVLLTFFIVLVSAVLFIVSQVRSRFFSPSQIQGRGAILPWVLLVLVPVYMAAILLNNVFFDATSSFSAVRRFLLPVYVAVAIGVLCMVYHLVWERPALRWLKAPVLAYIIVIILFQVGGSITNLRNSEMDLGLTNARRFWRDVIAGLQALEPSQPLISDNPQLLYVLCGRTAYRAPVLYNRFTAQYEQDFGMKLDEMHLRMDQGAILVIFQRYAEDVQSLPESEGYTQRITQGLVKLKGFSHATLYASSNAP